MRFQTFIGECESCQADAVAEAMQKFAQWKEESPGVNISNFSTAAAMTSYVTKDDYNNQNIGWYHAHTITIAYSEPIITHVFARD